MGRDYSEPKSASGMVINLEKELAAAYERVRQAEAQTIILRQYIWDHNLKIGFMPKDDK